MSRSPGRFGRTSGAPAATHILLWVAAGWIVFMAVRVGSAGVAQAGSSGWYWLAWDVPFFVALGLAGVSVLLGIRALVAISAGVAVVASAVAWGSYGFWNSPGTVTLLAASLVWVLSRPRGMRNASSAGPRRRP